MTVGGVHMTELNPDIGSDRDAEGWSQIHKEVVNRCVDHTSGRLAYPC